ncbi:universal stress protein [Streptosporangium canum]|uniref:universal stress protein n=1 Tax=Streptosporangium canum TaxID=324952 RepID=UPI0036CD1074
MTAHVVVGVDGSPSSRAALGWAAADLAVVGSRGLGRVGSAVLGSVGHGVVHYARCPVAVVRARKET